MQRRRFFNRIGATALFSILFKNKSFSSEQIMKNCVLQPGEIQHMVIFNLSHEKGTAEAVKFIQDGTHILSAIPEVMNFQAFSQTSTKNNYQYGFSMIFSNQKDYEAYNDHPKHSSFVQERWLKEVTDFLEIDFSI